MLASGLNASSAAIDTSVSETIKRINASAIDLVAKRSEIDLRIRLVQQVMRGLRYLEARQAFDGSYAQSLDSGRTKEPPARRNSRRRTDDGGALPVLTRACRIALMEAESAASLEEVHTRIIRRGSFLFSDSESSAKAILSALNAMTDRGELRRLDNRDQALWQRIVTTWISTSLRNCAGKNISPGNRLPDNGPADRSTDT
jgi:hypothetical protein